MQPTYRSSNTCFQRYEDAREYHEMELNLSIQMRNRKNEANALGNLGNTLRSLNQFSEAADRCRAQLQIWRDLGQRQGEARALYNLGNIFHAQAKAIDGSSKAEGHRVGNFWNFEVVIVKNQNFTILYCQYITI